MKVLFITGIFPPAIGGPASYVPRLGAEISLRHEVTVVTLGDFVESDNSFPFNVCRVSKTGSAWSRRFRTIKKIRREAQTVDVVLVNGLFFEAVLALPRTVPVIAKVVGDTVWERARNSGETQSAIDDFQKNQGSLKLRALHFFQGRSICSFGKVFTPSKYLAEIVTQWGVAADRLSVIPNSVKIPPPSIQLPEFDIVCVSRLVPWKGIMELVQLVTEQNLSLSLVGDGPLRAELESFLISHPSSKVEIKGAVPMEQVTHEIRRGRVFVLNSSYEGLPHVVLEAQAAGVPVVATRSGGTPECIEDGVTGFLVDKGNIDHLRETVAVLLENKLLRKKIAEAALARIQADFSFSQMVERTESLMVSAVAAR